MRKMVIVAVTALGTAFAQNADYTYVWEKAENGYFGTQKQGMNYALNQKRANLGELAIITSRSLIKSGDKSGLFVCTSYENVGATKETVFLKRSESMRFVSASDAGGALRPFFDLIASPVVKDKINAYTSMCMIDNVGRIDGLKISTIQVPIGARMLIGDALAPVYVTVNASGLDFDFQIIPPTP